MAAERRLEEWVVSHDDDAIAGKIGVTHGAGVRSGRVSGTA